MPESGAQEILDARGLLCPMPVVKVKLAMEELAPGEVLKVLATDPAAPRDFEVWCRETGNQLLESSQEDSAYTFLIQKAGG
jgi:tRNA 2-thiouridine synthesizing protein A